jgi:hypothetical protein
MKLRLSIAIVALMLLQMSCALINRATDSLSTTPIVTSGPATQTAPPPAPTNTRPTQPSLPTPTAAPTAPAEPSPTAPAPIATLPPAQPGPEQLDLSDPGLYKPLFSNYTDQLNDKIEGVDSDGKPTTIEMGRVTRFQSQPSNAWYLTSTMFGDLMQESAAIDGQLYTAIPGSDCTQTTAGEAPQSPFALLATVLTGQANRVEQGVEINGLPADRYALTKENLKPGAEMALTDITVDGSSTVTSTTTLRFSGEGSLYLAQQGGFLVRFELTDSKKATPDEFFFAPGTEMKSTRVIELIPDAAGDPPIAPPAGCQEASGGKPKPGSGEPTPGTTVNYLKVDDAQIILEDAGELIYQTNKSLDEVKAFYAAEMPAQGWTAGEETRIGPIVNLSFTQGDQTVTITLVQTGDTVTVQISGS